MLPSSRVPRSEAAASASPSVSSLSPTRTPQSHLRQRRRRRSLASLLAVAQAEAEAIHGGEEGEFVGQRLPASLLALRPSGAQHRGGGGGAGASELRRRCEMDVVCEVCGAVGYRHLLVQCKSCKNATRHRGIMKIDQEYISLAAHLSNQACKKVQELSLSLPPVMKVTKHWKLKVCPSRWGASEITAESIGLYFFSDNMRPNKELDRLVQYVTDHSIVLKYVFGLSKLLIFPSALLPEQCQTLQGKHYLWGVFRRRSGKSKAASQEKQKASTSYAMEKRDHQDKVQGETQDQETPVLKVQGDTQNLEMPVSKGSMPSERQPSPGDIHDVGTEVGPSDHRKPANSEAPPTKLLSKAASQVKQKTSTSHATEKKDHQDKVQGNTQDPELPVSKVQGDTQNQEIPVSKGSMPSENQPSQGDIHDVGTEVDPSDHRKPANSEAPPTKLIVVAQTPRSEQFIKELENEGALVFAVKGLMKPGLVRLSASNAVGSELTRDNDAPA